MAEIRGRTVNSGEVEFYDAETGEVVLKLNTTIKALQDALETTADPGGGGLWNSAGTLKVGV